MLMMFSWCYIHIHTKNTWTFTFSYQVSTFSFQNKTVFCCCFFMSNSQNGFRRNKKKKMRRESEWWLQFSSVPFSGYVFFLTSTFMIFNTIIIFLYWKIFRFFYSNQENHFFSFRFPSRVVRIHGCLHLSLHISVVIYSVQFGLLWYVFAF